MKSLWHFLATIPTAALSALLDQCRAISHAIDCAVWGDDEDDDLTALAEAVGVMGPLPHDYDEAYNETLFDAAADFYQELHMYDAVKFAAAMRAWKSMPCPSQGQRP